jgi:hypothetical protein
MARLHLRSLRRALKPSSSTHNESVHFHSGPQGAPEVCFANSCSRPRLEVH